MRQCLFRRARRLYSAYTGSNFTYASSSNISGMVLRSDTSMPKDAIMLALTVAVSGCVISNQHAFSDDPDFYLNRPRY